MVCLEAALGRQDLEHALHLVHVLALVQVRAQQRLHDVGLHQPLHALLQAYSEGTSQHCVDELACAAPDAYFGSHMAQGRLLRYLHMSVLHQPPDALLHPRFMP